MTKREQNFHLLLAFSVNFLNFSETNKYTSLCNRSYLSLSLNVCAYKTEIATKLSQKKVLTKIQQENPLPKIRK